MGYKNNGSKTWKSNSRGGNGGYGGGRSGGGYNRGGERRQTEMHPATCAECDRSCEVPFRPSGSKPVLCRDCFRGADGGSSRGPSREGSDNTSRQLKLLNAKMDQILKMLGAFEIEVYDDQTEEDEEMPQEETDETETESEEEEEDVVNFQF